MRDRLLLAALVAATPCQAWAHSSLPGIKGFYWGMLHPFTVAPEILLLFAMGLVIQQRISAGQPILLALLGGMVIGAAVAAFGLRLERVDLAITGLAIVASLLVAAEARLGSKPILGLGIMTGLASGFVSWPDPGGWNAMLLSATGAIVGAMVIVIVVAGGIEGVRAKTEWSWLRIAVRVAGSWICAIAVLLGALALRGIG